MDYEKKKKSKVIETVITHYYVFFYGVFVIVINKNRGTCNCVTCDAFLRLNKKSNYVEVCVCVNFFRF